MKEKSKVDRFIEEIEKGLEPPKLTNKKGSLIVIPKNSKPTERKKLLIMSLMAEVHHPLLRFLDLESENMLDEKIKVLTDLKNGKTISEIPSFYNILELYPKEDEMWD